MSFSVLIVDDDGPEDVQLHLATAFRDSGVSASCSCVHSPAQMFGRLAEAGPAVDLVLLDHHWPEQGIEAILTRLKERHPDIKVVVFTGKLLQLDVILGCARLGVADYVVKGSQPFELLARKLHLIATSSEKTIGSLAMPSGTFGHLIEAAERTRVTLELERRRRDDAEHRLVERTSRDAREIRLHMVRSGTVLLYLFICGLASFGLYRIGYDSPYGSVVLLVVAMGGLFVIDRSISKVKFTAGRTRVDVQRASE